MKQCLSCKGSVDSCCLSCNDVWCHHCWIIKHLHNKASLKHVLNALCEECEVKPAEMICPSCEELLCDDCDKAIHKKAKRTQHIRKKTDPSLILEKVNAVVYLSAAFLKKKLDSQPPEKFEDQIEEIHNKVSKSSGPNILMLTFFKSDAELTKEDQELRELTKKLKIRCLVVYGPKELRELEESRLKIGEKLPEVQLTDQNIYRKILEIARDFEKLERMYIYDIPVNEGLFEDFKYERRQREINFYFNFEEQINQEENEFEETKNRDSLREGSEPISREPATRLSSSSYHQDPGEIGRDIQDYPVRDVLRLPQELINILHLDPDPFLQPSEDLSPNRPSLVKPLEYLERNPPIGMTQPLKEIPIGDILDASLFLQKELTEFANQGELLVYKPHLERKLAGKLLELYNMDLGFALDKASEKGIIHFTIRKFPNVEPYYYVGMLLDDLTIESLTWVVRSIRNDMMTPNEKIINSRIKECYGLKIETEKWKDIINYILSMQDKEFTPPDVPTFSRHRGTFPLRAIKNVDPITEAVTYSVFLRDEEWEPEDQGKIDEKSVEWKAFLNFIDEFFREDDNKYFPEKKNPWNSSVENILNRDASKKENSVGDDVIAIPGGRYGCAQFIKICGPEILKNLSIGKLTLFVQEIINRGILRYQKTLLVKNNPNDPTEERDQTNNLDIKKSKFINKVKEAIIDILEAHPDGVTLAQIPMLLRRRLNQTVDFPELGFPKLKNFLVTMSEYVKLESQGSNQSIARLREDAPVYYRHRKGHSHHHHNEKKYYPKKIYSNMVPSAETKSADSKIIKYQKKKPEDRDKILLRAKSLIEEILKENSSGLFIEMLYKELCTRLTFDFDFRLFNSKDFAEFLGTHCESFVDIEPKKNNQFVIYLKNYKFGPPQVFMKANRSEDPETTPIKNPQNYFPSLQSPITHNYPPGIAQKYETPPGLNPSLKKANFSSGTGMSTSSLSPIGIYGNEDPNAVTPENYVKKSNYWPFSTQKYPDLEKASQFNLGSHSKSEPSAENDSQLKFIESLLEEGEEKHPKPTQFYSEKKPGMGSQMPSMNMSYGQGSMQSQKPNQMSSNQMQNPVTEFKWNNPSENKTQRKTSK